MVTILLFASFRETAGRSEFQIEAGEGNLTVADLFAKIVLEVPQLEGLKKSARVAVNQEYATWDHPVHEGDEIVFFPPVSGGCA